MAAYSAAFVQVLARARWRKSSRSRNVGDGPVLTVSPVEWRAFVAGAKGGESDR